MTPQQHAHLPRPVHKEPPAHAPNAALLIDVGIRESSSDLLIQNCDEYFSYNELAGLTKESDVTTERRDPWELVVEAVKQMTAHNDVMRSDRLKQVMQEIDPTFNEKDIGFSRFSKFVVEAAHRGLINLKKLDNGQYETSLGPGVPGAAAQPTAGGAPRGEAPREERPRRRAADGGRREEGRRGAGAGSGAGSGAGGGGGGGFSLGEGFSLIKQALRRLGGEQPVSAEELRDTMIELKGEAAEPLESERFPKLLRQAHDAEIIDLSKEEDGAYAVKLHPGEASAPDSAEDAAAEPSQSPSAASVPPPPPPPAAPPGVVSVPSRSARFRRGSRGPRVAVAPPEIPKVGVVEVDPNFTPRIELVPVKPPEMPMVEPARTAESGGEGSRDRRGGRGGGGSRGGRGGRGGRGRGGRGGGAGGGGRGGRDRG